MCASALLSGRREAQSSLYYLLNLIPHLTNVLGGEVTFWFPRETHVRGCHTGPKQAVILLWSCNQTWRRKESRVKPWILRISKFLLKTIIQEIKHRILIIQTKMWNKMKSRVDYLKQNKSSSCLWLDVEHMRTFTLSLLI